MENVISLKEALAIIDRVDASGNAVPFDIRVRSLQRNSKTGGKLYEYIAVRKLRRNASDTPPNLLAVAQSGSRLKINPNHFQNRTRNLELQNKDIRKIHIRLIIAINGIKVVY
jgi:hypothetical protein